MKRWRVMVSATVLLLVLLAFLFLPIPYSSRIRSEALIEFQPDATQKVSLHTSGTLDELKVQDGEEVVKDQILAVFKNPELEREFKEYENEYLVRVKQLDLLEARLLEVQDPEEQNRLQQERSVLTKEQLSYLQRRNAKGQEMEGLVLKAPVAGVVIGPPKKDALGKYFEKAEGKPFCSIGDPTRLRAWVPVSPDDYELIKSDLVALRKDNPDANIDVTIRVQGHASSTWKGKLVEPLPLSECRDMPIPLTTRGGGSIAIKPGAPEGLATPQNQIYLLSVNFHDYDASIFPGTMGQVKIHCRWHSTGWWAWRTINNTFNLKLM